MGGVWGWVFYMIDPITIERIKEAADIVDVVSEFVSLKRSGSNYKGLCPFHNDRTPSFYVSPTRGTCHCFTCGEGGDSVGFLMKHEQLSYPEALRWLANRYGIEIEEKQLTDEQRKKQTEREAMFIVNNWAAEYYTDILHNDVDGRAVGMQYFRQRGFRDDIINKFRLGFSPADRYAMPRKAKEKGYNLNFLEQTGLCYKDNKGELVDRFSGRAMFPWISVSGNVVAFGGRVLDQRTKGVNQKYVNSPDSPIYHKDHELYGIYQAKKAIGKEDFVFMVEGYTDVISMHQCGIENVVANSGTALSVHQIHLLHRFTSNIVLLYDGDDAGIHAALRGTDMLLAEGMNVKVLLLPDGDDPDSFARKHTADDFRKYVEEHQTDFIQFKTELMLKNVKDPIKRAEAINSIVRSVSVIPDPIVRATYITECARRLDVDERTLISQTNKYIAGDREEQRKEQERQEARAERLDATGAAQQQVTPLTSQFSPLTSGNEVERLLVQNIVRHGHEIIFPGLEAEDGSTIDLNVAQYIGYDLGQDGLQFSNELYNQILQEAVEHAADEGFQADRYFMQHPDPQISQLAASLGIDRHQLSESFKKEYTTADLQQKIQHLILDFRMDIVNQRLKEIQRQLKTMGSQIDREQLKQLMDEYKDTQELRNALAKQRGSDVIV